ncbi:MAG TPA: DMSO reductase [Sedimenticola thiotaurini]|uniref:DMSO reductase n=2 Tax=Sedimenticola thiotaurini TaxID=1543721 RepID=A0A831RLH5_9GAMM|nr:DMSO reductase [Sedimenticola thiotaurini]
MHPAFSVIFLTTLIGVGQGLFLALYTGQVYTLAQLLPPQDSQAFYGSGSFVALLFLAGGLFASFFHLGHPERAWRAAARWRTSWLSREVIVLPLFMGLVALYALFHYVGWTHPLFTIAGTLPVDFTLIIGLLAAIAAFGLFICTAMIYAGVRFVQQWHHWLTVANYMLLGLASGFMLASAFSAWTGVDLVGFFGTWAVIFTLAALATRGAALLRNRRLRPKIDLQSAIGVKHRDMQQKAQGFMGGSFNTREFFHGRGPATLRLVRWAFLLLLFPLPVLLIGLSYLIESGSLPIAAFAVQYLGLLLERWYFFAEAEHPQNLYYQTMS